MGSSPDILLKSHSYLLLESHHAIPRALEIMVYVKGALPSLSTLRDIFSIQIAETQSKNKDRNTSHPCLPCFLTLIHILGLPVPSVPSPLTHLSMLILAICSCSTSTLHLLAFSHCHLQSPEPMPNSPDLTLDLTPTICESILCHYHKWLLTCSVIDLESFHKSRAYRAKLRRVTKDVVKSEV